MGKLFGLYTPAVEQCRVLELGCGEGGNLIPAAFSLPGAQFLGVDLSALAVNRAREGIRELGLTNVEARQLDVCNLPPDVGQFDYVIAHGLYSWVPPHVREHILALCRRVLSPNGVAYVSYNAYPGCRMREIAREAMKFAVDQSQEPVAMVEQSRDALRTIAAHSPEGEAYGALLRAETQRLADIDPNVVFHDDLAPFNQAFYFHEFVAEARHHDLQYVCDAEYGDSTDRVVHPVLAKLLDERAGPDVIRREQIADFVRGRGFRRTLLCHTNITLHRPASPQRLRGLYVASSVKPLTPEPASASGVLQFKTPKGATLSTSHALAKAALVHLGKLWPRCARFEELLDLAGPPAPTTADNLGEFLLTAAAAGAVEFRTHAPAMAGAPGPRPLASALARWQARRGPIVTTLSGASVKLEGSLARHLLLLLDGTRDQEAIIHDLVGLAQAGTVSLNEGGASVPPGRARELLRIALPSKLVDLARLGLLAG
jgi:methyltransferase-like protein/protein-L-isoaspartate O-methyltransferase